MLKKIFLKKHFKLLSYILGLLLILFFNIEIKNKIYVWKNINKNIRSFYSEANLFFLKKKYNEPFLNPEEFSSIFKTLYSMRFLDEEKNILQTFISNPDFIENKPLKKRLDFILSPTSNKMIFSKKFQECDDDLCFELNNPLELDLDDLLSVLSIIENSYYQKIPYFISELEINRTPTISKQEVWKLNYKLLKRCI